MCIINLQISDKGLHKYHFFPLLFSLIIYFIFMFCLFELSFLYDYRMIMYFYLFKGNYNKMFDFLKSEIRVLLMCRAVLRERVIF